MSLGAVQAAQNIKTPTPFIVFCGQFYSRQGYLNLIQAFVLTFDTKNDVVVVNILIRWKKTIATIDVMNNDEHWLHTKEQILFLTNELRTLKVQSHKKQ